MNEKKFVIDDGEYAWKYFSLHANQRLAVFNFFIFVCSLLVTGYLTLLKNGNDIYAEAILGILLIFLSFVFWKLDVRNKQMLKNVEEALKYLERNSGFKDTRNGPNVLKIFTYEEHKTKIIKKKGSNFSYSDCFNLVFLAFAGLGIMAVVISVFRCLHFWVCQ